ncbi:MAG: hypothetical protein ACRC6V_15650 [Bacteroidales bacterium]
MDNDSKFSALLIGLLLLCFGVTLGLLDLAFKGWPDSILPPLFAFVFMLAMFAAAVPVAHYLVFGDESQ